MFRRRAWAVAAAMVVGLSALNVSATASAHPTEGAPATTADADPPGSHGRAEALVAEMTTAEQAASIVMGHIPTTDASALSTYMAQGLGGFILMGANIPATDGELVALTTALTVDPEFPPLIAIDQEGGIVSRLPGDDYASSTTLKTLPVADTSAAFSARAALVAKMGIGVDFGTVADVTADPASFIYGRALGTDPTSSADRVEAATIAQEQVVASTLKHFPGHGAAPGDSHHAIPTTGETLEEWRANDAVPFVAGIDAGASLLMFGHLAYTAVDSAPASLSARWHEIAREELGFDGVIVTDDLGMLQSSGLPEYSDPVVNAVTAVVAGSDLVLMIAGSTADTASEIVAGITAAVDAGTLPAERLADAATRVLSLRLQSTASSARWSLCAECEPAG
ncbi:glycoside hydrolase family 3 N-terminal domain-containing protein [Microbacterium phyllosphaerae]|uniref:glycoside hydrolase family 3 N-terminal domain-containing protein n=1 Tax=Microbacterium phyllosphaerae TaxID=124798 RepID=UPI0021689F68|nr:glycoside hydrolase family 3 N-terminal domain-containing protein [Microbacterium phyllosphaerae]MCS3444435.1 beta-N-acetylhexosaminidase [Microbacterium phyllosphaerae]